MNHPPIPPHTQAMPDDILERAIQSLEQSAVPPGPSPELIAATLAAINVSRPAPIPVPRSGFLTRRILMRSLSATASVAVLAIAALFLPNEFGAHSRAYADVLEQIKAARTLTFTNDVYTETRSNPIKTKEFIAEDGRSRSEHESGVVTIRDANSMIRLTLIGRTKTALVYPPREAARPVKQSRRDWIESLAKLGDKPDKELGEQTLDGQKVVGFEVSQGTYKYTLWLDAKSKQLVRIERESHIKGSSIIKTAMADFHFDEPLDEALFSFDPPAEYKVQTQTAAAMPKSLVIEENVVEALRGYTQKSDGKFPKSITEWGEWSVLLSKGATDAKLSDETTKVMGHLGAITALLSGVSKDDYAYLGEGKTVKETDAIIFWCKNKQGVYRAVYGDLSVKDISKEQLPASVKK